jgi:hypothetical protein
MSTRWLTDGSGGREVNAEEIYSETVALTAVSRLKDDS